MNFLHSGIFLSSTNPLNLENIPLICSSVTPTPSTALFSIFSSLIFKHKSKFNFDYSNSSSLYLNIYIINYFYGIIIYFSSFDLFLVSFFICLIESAALTTSPDFLYILSIILNSSSVI